MNARPDCHFCAANDDSLPWAWTVMILCPDCGNKRCPKASDHRLACTRSNEPGQPGSVYRRVSGGGEHTK